MSAVPGSADFVMRGCGRSFPWRQFQAGVAWFRFPVGPQVRSTDLRNSIREFPQGRGDLLCGVRLSQTARGVGAKWAISASTKCQDMRFHTKKDIHIPLYRKDSRFTEDKVTVRLGVHG